MICVVANKSLFINKQTDVHVSHANCRKKNTHTHSKSHLCPVQFPCHACVKWRKMTIVATISAYLMWVSFYTFLDWNALDLQIFLGVQYKLLSTRLHRQHSALQDAYMSRDVKRMGEKIQILPTFVSRYKHITIQNCECTRTALVRERMFEP